MVSKTRCLNSIIIKRGLHLSASLTYYQNNCRNMNHRIVLLLCLQLLLVACIPVQTTLDSREFRIHGSGTDKAVYRVEIARTESARRRGLMFREILPADQGMLLSYKRPGIMAIWMKNTSIPLDILFIDEDDEIVKIHEDAVPHSTQRILSVVPVISVLELNAGQVRTHGIKVGDRMLPN